MIRIGGLVSSLQNFKVIAILYLAYIYSRREKRLGSEDTSVVPVVFILAISGLVILNDMGTWMVIARLFYQPSYI